MKNQEVYERLCSRWDGYLAEGKPPAARPSAYRINTTYFSTRATMARERRRDRLVGALGLAGCLVAVAVYCYIIWRTFKP